MKLCIPPKILAQHVAVLGKTGSGKSSVLRYLVEHLLEQGKRVVIIDPKGDWWGLKTSADGKRPGFNVVALGDFKEEQAQDVPINEHSGAHVAELIATGNRPCVIGFRGWMTSQMINFWLDFAPTLFNKNMGELYLIGDEFHNFAPKGKILDPQAGKCLHWSNRLMSEGRGLGIVCLIASQRPQKVHNDTLTCCETLVAMRVVHEADRNAVREWVDGCGDLAKGRQVVAALAGLKRGTAYVWSPEAGFGPELIEFPLFSTFDSFAPPQTQKQVQQSGWADIDIEEIEKKLHQAMEEHRANDPKELKKEIARLKMELNKKVAESETVKSVEVSMLTAEDRKLLENVIEDQKLNVQEINSAFRAVSDELNNFNANFQDLITPVQNKILSKMPAAKPMIQKTAKVELFDYRPPNNVAADSAFKLSKAGQRVLDAIRFWESIGVQQPSTIQVGAVAQVDPSGGYFNNLVGPLSSLGYIVRYSGQMELTEAGRALTNTPYQAPTLEAYHSVLRERIYKIKSAGGKTVEMFNAICSNGRGNMTTEELGQIVGVNHTGGYFNNMIGPLSSIGLIERRGGLIHPTEILFPEGIS